MNNLIPSMFKSSSSSRRNRRRREKKKELKRIANSVIAETYKPVKRKIAQVSKNTLPPAAYDILASVYRGVGKGVTKNRRRVRSDILPRPSASVEANMIGCGHDVLQCAMSPFAFPRDICLPVTPLAPTFKTRIINNVTFNAGTQGVAFLLLAPCLSQDISIYYSGSSYTGTVYSDDTSATGVNGITNASLFTAAQFDDDYGEGSEPLSGRVNMIAIEVTPLASYMNRKGLLRLSLNPNRSSLAGLSGTQCANWHTTKTYNMATYSSSSPVPGLTVIATSPQELALRPQLGIASFATATKFPWSVELSAPGGGSPMIGVFIDGASHTDAFNVKIISRVEYVGELVSSYSTIGAINTEAYSQAASMLAENLYKESSYLH